MSWVATSLLMAFGSTLMYLVLRLSNHHKTAPEWNNLTVFLFPAVFFTLLALFMGIDLRINFINLLIIFVVKSALFQFVAGLASLKSIALAPNPGYSLTISKSYAILTAVLSAIFFQSPLPIGKLGIILLVIILAAFLSFEKKQSSTNVSNTWVTLALIPFFFWGFDSMLSKYLLNQGLSVITLLVYGCWSASIVSLIHLRTIKISMPSSTQLKILAIYGVFTCIFYYFRQESIRLAPNVGFVNAISTASIALVTVMSAIIFKDKLSLLKLAFIIGIIVNIYWLTL